jgi:lactoylglutathione lyase
MSGINIEKVDYFGIRVRDLDRALAFYQVLGFKLAIRVTFDPVAIIRNEHSVEINLILNADAGDPEKNILMDLGDKYAGYTHAALRVASINDTMATLKAANITITQGPSKFGDDAGSRCSCAIRTAMSSNCADPTRATFRTCRSTRT